MNKPSPARATRTTQVTGKLAPVSSYGRDLFRTSTPQSARTTKFAPSIPADASRMSPRKYAQKSAHGGMSNIPSTEPFKLRIPSPDPDLSGEALSKEVPDDPTRTGTIYADQFLAHKCPANFDDLQRRQFFCILDLRRLKYAANEIFAKKDWKLNIMNFAKEYEKSRGLIMLRYGLYEFKNVKPSEEVLKRWRSLHNLPDIQPETESNTSTAAGSPVKSIRRPSGLNTSTSTKRKAEDDLVLKDNTLMASTANQNKRRNVAQEPVDASLTGPAPFKKSKRKMDETDEPDENQPNKIQKPASSAAKSKFESFLNKSQSSNTSPLKRAPLAPFGAQKSSDNLNLAAKSNPFAGTSNGLKPTPANTSNGRDATGSVLANGSFEATPAKTGSNIFSYLSGSSANSSGNENGNPDEGDTESELEDNEDQEAGDEQTPPNKRANVADTVSTFTPSAQSGSALFTTPKPSTGPTNIFNSFSKPSNDLTSKGGLFGRVQVGSDGQPLRATASIEEPDAPAPVQQPVIKNEPSKTPAKQPGDYTFNAATTPISFGPPASEAPKTPAVVSTTESNNKSDNAPTAKTPAALFGANAPAKTTFQPSGSSLFGSSNNENASDMFKPKSDGAAKPVFTGQNLASGSSSIFGTPATNSLFGGVGKANETTSSATKNDSKSTLDAASTTTNNTASQAITEKTPVAQNPTPSIFGASTASTVNASQPPSLFGQSIKPTESKENGSVGSSTLFGGSGASKASALFGEDKTKINGSSTAKSVFDRPIKNPSASFTFGSSKSETKNEANKPSISFNQGTNTPSATPAKPIFGSEISKPVQNTTGSSLFGDNSAPATSTNLFGAKSGGRSPFESEPTTTAAPPMFGSNSPSTSMFNTQHKVEPATANTNIFSFGAQSQPPPATRTSQSPAPPMIFGAQAAPSNTRTSQSPAPPMIFGGISNTPQPTAADPMKTDFAFGSSAPSVSAPSSFNFGQGTTDTGTSFTFTAGGNGQSFNNPFAASSATPSAPMFGNNNLSTPALSASFTFGQQTPSTPAPAPVSQGNALFGASTNGGNAGPSFSFTQATPNQNSPNPFAPKPTPSASASFGSFLQGGAGASSRGSQ